MNEFSFEWHRERIMVKGKQKPRFSERGRGFFILVEFSDDCVKVAWGCL